MLADRGKLTYMKKKPTSELRRWLVAKDGQKTAMAEPGFCIPLSSGCWVSVNLAGPWHLTFAVDVCTRSEFAKLDLLPQLKVVPHGGNFASVEIGSAELDSAEPLDVMLVGAALFEGQPARGGTLPRSPGDTVSVRKFLVEYGDTDSVTVEIVDSDTALFALRIQSVSTIVAAAGDTFTGLTMLLSIGASNVLHFWFSEVEITHVV